MDLQNELMRNSALNSALEGPRDTLGIQSNQKPRPTDPSRRDDPRVSANNPSSNFASKYLEFMGADEPSVSKHRESGVQLPAQQDLFQYFNNDDEQPNTARDNYPEQLEEGVPQNRRTVQGQNISFGEKEGPMPSVSENRGHLPTIKSDFEPTDSNIDDFRAMKYDNPDQPDSGRKSAASFAEEVEKEISIQEFRAQKKANESAAASKASDSQGNMQRGRPRESEIEKISVTQRKSESPARGGSLSSLGRGSGLNKDPQMPFVDEKLSNINDSRAYNAPVNQSHLENLASVFESIDPIKPIKKNIQDINESLAEIEQQSFRAAPPTPKEDKRQPPVYSHQQDDIYRHHNPLFKEDSPSVKVPQSDQKSYTFQASETKEKPYIPPLEIKKEIKKENKMKTEVDKFEEEFRAWQAQKNKPQPPPPRENKFQPPQKEPPREYMPPREPPKEYQQPREQPKEYMPPREPPREYQPPREPPREYQPPREYSPKKEEMRVQVVKSPNRSRGQITDSEYQTSNMNDISEGYDQSVKSFTGPLNTTLGNNLKNQGPKVGSAVQPNYQDSLYDQQFSAVASPPQLHPQRQQRREQESFVSNRSLSGAKMSPAGRKQQFADGRQSRGSSNSRGRAESELHAVSIVKKKEDETPKRTPFRGARDVSLELKMKKMAEDAARAQEAQRQLELMARQKRLQQQEQLLAGFKNSKIDIKRKQPPPVVKQVLSESDGADDFGNEDDFNEQSAGGNSYQNQAMTPKVGYHASNGTKSYYGQNDKTMSQQSRVQNTRVGIHAMNQRNELSDPDVFSDKTQEVMTPQSKHQAFENLYYQVVQDEDPHQALKQVVMRDKRTYDYYKDGLHLISQWIDKEMLRRSKQKEQEMQRQAELKRMQDEMQDFMPQTATSSKGKMGSNFAGRKQSQSPARLVKGEEQFNKRKEQWVNEQNYQKDREIERMQQNNYMNQKVPRNRENSNASGHGSFLSRNYYNRRDSRASNDSQNSGSRSRGLQNVLNRSGSRSRFFSATNNSNSKISQNGNNGAIDRFSAINDDAGVRQNQLRDAQFESQRKQKQMSEVTANPDNHLVQALHREFTDAIRTVQAETGAIYLVDVLQELKFLNEEIFRGQETRLGVMLRQQRNNLIVGNTRKPKENEDILKNLFKVCCSIMNLKPIQRSYQPMDQKILSSYLDYLNLQKPDQDVIVLDQLATIKSLINRQPYQLGPQQVLQIHQKFRNLFMNRQSTLEQGKATMKSHRAPDQSRGMLQPQMNRQMAEGQQRQQLYSHRPQTNHDPRDLEYERQKEDNTFRPAVSKRPWQGQRPNSRAGSNASGGRMSGSGVQRPQEYDMYRQRNPGRPLQDMQNNIQEQESSVYQKYQNQPNTKYSNPNSYDENNEPRSSYLGARETYKNDVSPMMQAQNGARVPTNTTPQALISDEMSFNESFGAKGGSTRRQAPSNSSKQHISPAEISFNNQNQSTFRQQEPICILNIELDSQNVQEIRVYEGEDPRVIVGKFGDQFNLSDRAMGKLLQQIEQQIRISQQSRY